MIMNKMPVSLACDLQLSAYMVIRSMRAITLEASTEIDFFVLKGCVSDRVYGTYKCFHSIIVKVNYLLK